jgi:hypothetical protein
MPTAAVCEPFSNDTPAPVGKRCGTALANPPKGPFTCPVARVSQQPRIENCGGDHWFNKT